MGASSTGSPKAKGVRLCLYDESEDSRFAWVNPFAILVNVARIDDLHAFLLNIHKVLLSD